MLTKKQAATIRRALKYAKRAFSEYDYRSVFPEGDYLKANAMRKERIAEVDDARDALKAVTEGGGK